MVKMKLMITAEMENIASLQPMGGLKNPNFSYYFKLKCENCGEVTEKLSCVCLNEQVLSPASSGLVNLVQKCKLCGREGDIKLVPVPQNLVIPFNNIDSVKEKYVTLMGFECRGLAPFDYIFMGPQWKVQASSGTNFVDVDLSSGEWAEYDEKGKVPVAISNLKSKFEVVKEWTWKPEYRRYLWRNYPDFN